MKVYRLTDRREITLQWVRMMGGGQSWYYLVDEAYWIYEARHERDM
jgi:hypothetical protein